MSNQQAVVDQIVRNLAFDIEAVPKNKSIQTSSISQSTPLNVKIKVRKKDEIQKYQEVSSITDDTTKTIQKVRLVNSDRTIMTFDVFMEAEFEKKPSRKFHKQIFDILRPGICLGAMDDDKYSYMPSSSYSANITEPTKATKSDGTIKQTFTLSKNVYQDYTVSTRQEEPKWLFGKCKPGGCLDPPFSEDKYPYKPCTRSGPERDEEELDEDVGTKVNSNKKPITLHDEETQSNERQSSIFDSGIFKKKRRSSDKSTNTKLPEKTDPIVDIYQGESATNSASPQSNSIITYPPKTKSVSRMSDDKTVRSRGPSEEKPRRSFNDHSEPCFIPPKGVNRIKEKDTLDPNDYTKRRSSDITKLRPPVEESVPIPIPIPVSIPKISSSQNLEPITPLNDDLGDNANVTELDSILDQKSQEQQLQDKNNIKDTDTPHLPGFTDDKPVLEPITPLNDDLGDNANVTELDSILDQKSQEQQLQDKNNIKDTDTPHLPGFTDDKPVESSKTLSFISAIVEEPTAPDEIGDKCLDETKSPPLDNLPMLIPIPVTFPDAVDSKTKNDKLVTSDMDLAQSKESLAPKTTLPTIEETPFAASKQKNIDPENKSGENESNSNITPKPKYSDTEANEIPKEYLRTGGGYSDQESDSENSVTKASIIAETGEKRDSKEEDITEGIDKPTKQNDIKNDDTAATKDKEDMPNEVSKTGERKKSQRISQSRLPILQKSMSSLSGSKASAEDKSEKKRSGSPDKYLKNVGDRDSDLGSILSGSRTSSVSARNNRDTKRSDSPDQYLDSVGEQDIVFSDLPSGPKHETDSGDDKVLEPFSNKGYLDETTTSNDGKIDSYAEDQTRFPREGSVNFITAPVFVDNTELSPKSRPLKEADSKINSLVEPINTGGEYDPSGIPLPTQIPSREFGGDDETHSTGSRELIGTQSVIYDEAELIPAKSPEKHIERTPSSVKRVDPGISSIQSTSTLKSALKKDIMSVDLGFHSYVNDKNERILKTFDGANTPTRLPNDSVTVLKAQIRVSSNEIRIPVDSEHDMSIQIKKSNANQRVSISESGLMDDIDHGRLKKQRPPELDSDAEMRSSVVKVEERKDSTLGSDATDDHFIDYYEQELVPLQLIIKNLRNEIDFLASQQLVLKDKLYCSYKSKLPRLVHSNKKCYGCARK